MRCRKYCQAGTLPAPCSSTSSSGPAAVTTLSASQWPTPKEAQEVTRKKATYASVTSPPAGRPGKRVKSPGTDNPTTSPTGLPEPQRRRRQVTPSSSPSSSHSRSTPDTVPEDRRGILRTRHNSWKRGSPWVLLDWRDRRSSSVTRTCPGSVTSLLSMILKFTVSQVWTCTRRSRLCPRTSTGHRRGSQPQSLRTYLCRWWSATGKRLGHDPDGFV